MAASENGHAHVVEFLLSIEKDGRRVIDIDGYVRAVQSRSPKRRRIPSRNILLVVIVIDEEFRFDYLSWFLSQTGPHRGLTALHRACCAGHATVVRLLQGSGAAIHTEDVYLVGRRGNKSFQPNLQALLSSLELNKSCRLNCRNCGPGEERSTRALFAAEP